MDSYTQHIANVRENSSVIATDDICNAQGQLLVPKGAVLDQGATDRIVRFKLLRPIEECVAIENDIDGEKLFALISAMIGGDPYLSQINSVCGQEATLKVICDGYAVHPLLRQKLTVMEQVLPSVFDQALFCAWLAVLVGLSAEGRDDDIEQLFIACLGHDLGLLHIDPKLLAASDSLTPEQLRQLHAHPVISYKILEGLDGVSKSVANAALEHHENIDGTGFPAAKLSNQLGSWGRLVNLLDHIYMIYSNNIRPASCGLQDVIPVLTMNYYSNSNPYFKAAVSVLRLSNSDSFMGGCTDEEIMPLIDKVLQGHEYVLRFLESKQEIIIKLGHSHGDSQLFAIQNAYLHIYSLMAESGLINEGYMRWLEQVQENRLAHAYGEARLAFFMLQEIIEQIVHIKMQAQIFFADPNHADLLAKTPEILAKINLADVPYVDF